ncbi:MAG: carboxy terminal-processing peptidase, partial [Kiritimatiellae bacterium]|nr:carboxy terminal-processing peptidase [Kiritimatiellia bacterium]
LPWSVTNEVPYLSVDTKLKSLIPVLVEKSEKRRAADAKYSAYLKLLGNIESINKLKEVPLSLSKRKDLAKTEKELTSLQKELVPDDDNDDGGAEKNAAPPDLVLREGLKILVDLVGLQKESPSIVSQPVNPPQKTITEMLDEWLRGIL